MNEYSITPQMLRYSMTEQILHGMEVSNLAFDLAEELGCREPLKTDLAIAGLLHDIGKIPLGSYGQDQDILVVEEMRLIRMHPELGAAFLEGRGFSDAVPKAIRFHHENYDGTGYPRNLCGENIPYGARILRICDVYCALTSNRPYRKAFAPKQAVRLMIEESKNFDLRMFLAFQRVIHEKPRRSIQLENVDDFFAEICREKSEKGEMIWH